MVSRKTSAMTRTRHISATVTGVASERAFATFIGREAPEPAERGMAGRVRRTPLRRILRVRNRRASQLDAQGNLGLVPVARRTQGLRDRFPHDFLLAPVIFRELPPQGPCPPNDEPALKCRDGKQQIRNSCRISLLTSAGNPWFEGSREAKRRKLDKLLKVRSGQQRLFPLASRIQRIWWPAKWCANGVSPNVCGPPAAGINAPKGRPSKD